MNCLVWNCRGAGGKEFLAFLKDSTRIYNWDFIAILEPRVSGLTADKIIQKIGFPNHTKDDAEGFSGGIWCVWKSSCPQISVHSSSKYCIHLMINGNSHNCWFLSIVYASPRPYQRLDVWIELAAFNNLIAAPWCLAGDFNQALFDWEKQGGGHINTSASLAFSSCIDECHLMDLAFNGQPFTYQHGELRERLDRVL